MFSAFDLLGIKEEEFDAILEKEGAMEQISNCLYRCLGKRNLEYVASELLQKITEKVMGEDEEEETSESANLAPKKAILTESTDKPDNLITENEKALERAKFEAETGIHDDSAFFAGELTEAKGDK